ncbi:MAG: hypothetical protein QF755_00715 [Candidatus Peribacteraceae bacterium]|mgnify:CR=1 FL=1|jgi:hypothetical protein|nr:hypothetical protein [Candidatus Peribacteraceae bacterium]HCI03609.1 hypothetical protein [Candidatus Peribacteria bacterium]|tara:strand:+ start:3333 stop:3977 length:645 start_codon:yes stop_codon:yes gene_type:complete
MPESMSSEIATNRDEKPTSPCDAQSPERSSESAKGPVFITITQTKDGKTIAVPTSPAAACLRPNVGPEQLGDSPYTEDFFFRILELFREEFEASMRIDEDNKVSRIDEWQAVRERILQVLEILRYDYEACTSFIMVCKCDLVNTDAKARFVIPDHESAPPTSLADMPWISPDVISNLRKPPIRTGKVAEETVLAPLYVGEKLVAPREVKTLPTK